MSNIITSTPSKSLVKAPQPIVQLDIILANTEYSYTFPVTTKTFTYANGGNSVVSYSYVSGGVFMPMRPGQVKTMDMLELTGSVTIYFKSEKSAQTIILDYWT